MFDFFEGLIEKLGVKLISDFTNKLYDWIKDIKNNNKEENNDNGSNSAQIGSSGYSARIGSSGDYAQIGSSGDYARIGSSGYSARIGSSGYSARIGSSGDSAQIGSSGYSARIGSSGYSARIGSSGDSAQIGSSGYSARIGSSGDSAQIGSSGDYARIDISGESSIGFACGYNSIIKAKKGTWISLAEYGRNEDDEIMPVFAKSAQIGNKEYKDHNGKMLKANTYYTLWKKEFYPVEIYDGIKTIIISKKKRDNITIIKAIRLNDLLDEEIKEIFISVEGKLSAHAYTLREAIEDLTFKKMESIDTSKIVEGIRNTGKVTRMQYRAITGACSFGTNKFCEDHNIQDLEEIELTELRKILVNDYGAEKFWNLIDEK